MEDTHSLTYKIKLIQDDVTVNSTSLIKAMHNRENTKNWQVYMMWNILLRKSTHMSLWIKQNGIIGGVKREASYDGQSQAGAGNNVGFMVVMLSPTAKNVRSKK